MNTRLLLCITLLLSTGRIFCATDDAPEADEPASPYANQKSIVFMRDFLDKDKEPDKPFSWWVKHLLLMIKQDKQKFKQFLREFVPAYKARNAKRIGLAFFKHKDKFDPEVVALIKKMGINNVHAILEIRVRKK